MQKTKLIRLLSSCSKRELDKFERYLTIHLEKSEDVKELFTFLKQFYNDWENPALNNKNLQLAFTQSQDAKSIGNLNSKLFLHLLDYLAYQELADKKNHVQKEILIASIYENRGLHDLKRRQLGRLQEFFTKKKLTAPWDIIHQLKVFELQYYDEEDRIFDATDLLVKTIDKLNEFTNSLKIKYNSELLGRIQFLNLPHLQSILDASLNTPVNHESFFQSIYYTLFQAFQTAEDFYFDETFVLLKKSHDRIDDSDRHHILLYLINYAARQSRKNKYIYSKTLFDLYKYGVDENLLLENHSISRVRFHNVVDVACKLKKITFARNFVTNYKQYLAEDTAKQTSYLASLLILFAEKNFDELQSQFVTTNFKFLDEKFRFKSLEICCFYELNFQEKLFLNKCKAFKNFLDRKKDKIGYDFISSYRNFTRIVEKLYDKTLPKSKIEQELESAKNIVLKYWLQEKLEDYRQEY